MSHAQSARIGRMHLSNLPPEIWSLVAEQIHSPQTFIQLIQVCRTFHSIFVPFLHRSHSLLLSRKPAHDWLSWPIPAYLKHAPQGVQGE
ncbi:uncharacterized protein LY89DRAFT_26160 [Mollisia scopiformis]|uniref:F-box domain-containing protein n=1 Tax=Mollisia scopiformis TaxID=149040 RepID=A0A194XWM5_MOLSC|nr:uncharacterized protein LY89DRAFT_26160 [Mollisia scopiformis]KUJ24633.1 hypothetical protein LY89DRAFT_26160 [Mollisia scopiformis]